MKKSLIFHFATNKERRDLVKRKISKAISVLLSILILFGLTPVLAENQTFEVTTNIRIHYDLGYNGGHLQANIYEWMPDVCTVTINGENYGAIKASDLAESKELEGQQIFSYSQTVDEGSSINNGYCISLGKGYRFEYPTYNNADNENGIYSFNDTIENVNRDTVKNIDVFIGLGTTERTVTIRDVKGNILYEDGGEFDVGTNYSLPHPNLFLEGNYAVIDVAVDNPSPVIEYYKESYIQNNSSGLIILDFYAMPEYMNITVTVLDADAVLKVIANYIDENGNKLAESEIIEGCAYDKYATTAKSISGYELISEPDNAEGIMLSEETVVDYIYKKVEKPEIPTEPVPNEPVTESVPDIDTKPVTEPTAEIKSPSTGADTQIAFLGAIAGIVSCLIFFFITILKKHKQKHKNIR